MLINLEGVIAELLCEDMPPPVAAAKLGFSFSLPHMDCWATLVKESLNNEYSSVALVGGAEGELVSAKGGARGGAGVCPLPLVGVALVGGGRAPLSPPNGAETGWLKGALPGYGCMLGETEVTG